MPSPSPSSISIFAPATVANVAVGFDILGFPIEKVGDTVHVKKIPENKIIIEQISGVVRDLPLDPHKNTATAGLLKLFEEVRPGFGLAVSIEKGISLGSGMGGSAASAVGAIVAANSLLPQPLSREKVFQYALEGESISSGSMHADNVSPCLYGGLTLTTSMDPPEIITIPVPSSISCVLIHPHLRVDTQMARGILKKEIPMKSFTQQTAQLGGFIAGCFTGDLNVIQKSFRDEIIEPQRAHLIPGFYAVQKVALRNGALGCSISGSGPSIFAWVDSQQTSAEKVQKEMIAAFHQAGVEEVDAWISPISQNGARAL